MRCEGVQHFPTFMDVSNWHTPVDFQAVLLTHAVVQKQKKVPGQKNLFLANDHVGKRFT